MKKQIGYTKIGFAVASLLTLSTFVAYFFQQKQLQSPSKQLAVSQPADVQNNMGNPPATVVAPQSQLVTDNVTVEKKKSSSEKTSDKTITSVSASDSDRYPNDEDGKDEEAAEKKSQQNRWLAEFEMIKNPKTNQIPVGIQQKSIKSAKQVAELKLPNVGTGLSQRTIPNIGVTVRGPNNYGGRTRAITFDKNNVQNIIAGGVSSGIYRSTDGGSTWKRATPSGLVQGVTAIAQDPRAGQGNTWYFGTGEYNNSAGGTGASYLGNGLWKSTDNGVTWAELASTQRDLYTFDNAFDHVSRIIVDATGAILVAAGESIMRSEDGGANWLPVLGKNGLGAQCDIIFNAASSTFYAGMYGTTTGSGTAAGIYSSTDGRAWTQIRTPTQLDASGVQRIVLANVGATPNVLALYEAVIPFVCPNGDTSSAGLQLYEATAATWTDQRAKISNCSGVAKPKIINFQEGYNMCMVTKPDDGDLVYLGGTEIYRLRLSTGEYQYIGGDQGSANATNLHVDNHILLFEPNSNTKLWVGNDGGIRNTDVTGAIAAGPTGGYTWNDRTTGYITYQYYRADINPANGSNFAAGAAQDNAITLQPATATAREIYGGDGTAVGIISGTDFETFNVIAATQEGAIVRIENNVTQDIQPKGQDQGFNTYFLLDADNTNYLYYPTKTKNLFRTRIARTIKAVTISGNATTGWEEITGIAATLTGRISAMSATRDANLNNADYTASDAKRKMYIGTNDGKVYRLADPAFCDVAAVPVLITPTGASASAYVSDIAVNPYNDKEVMVTYSNYGVPSVFYTEDATAASPVWVNVEGPAGSAVELASARTALIVRAGTVPLYVVGTSTGLYATMTLSGETTVWERVGTADIAFSPSVSLRLRTSDNKAILATHGNGMFMLAFPAADLASDLADFKPSKDPISVYPNPSTAAQITLSVTVGNNSEITMEWTDIAGRSRLKNNYQLSGGSNQIPMDVSSLESGIYFITTRNTSNRTVLETVRFVKQ